MVSERVREHALRQHIGDVEYMTVIMLTNGDAHACTIWRFGRHETRGLTVYRATASTLEQAQEQAAAYLRSLRNGSES
ncbi:MAG: hypothetical protein ACT4P5_12625 [Armatimonadota bacterium]